MRYLLRQKLRTRGIVNACGLIQATIKRLIRCVLLRGEALVGSVQFAKSYQALDEVSLVRTAVGAHLAIVAKSFIALKALDIQFSNVVSHVASEALLAAALLLSDEPATHIRARLVTVLVLLATLIWRVICLNHCGK